MHCDAVPSEAFAPGKRRTKIKSKTKPKEKKVKKRMQNRAGGPVHPPWIPMLCNSSVLQWVWADPCAQQNLPPGSIGEWYSAVSE